jgi:hypothetical protein
MNTKTFLALFLFVAVLFNFSCDKFIGYEIIISNNTSDTIYFDFDRKYGFSPDGNIYTTTCLPATETIYKRHAIPPDADLCPRNPNLSKPLAVRTSSGRELKKNIQNIDNWICEEIPNDILRVTFEINEEDLE